MTPELKSALARVLAQQPGGGRRAGAAALSQHYRAGGRTGMGSDLAAYLTVRLPATYAAVARVLEEIRLRRPEFAPFSLLDAGCGPGTASWAAAATWPELGNVTMVDSNREFLALAGRLAAESSRAAVSKADRQVGEIERLAVRASLVIASYALAEIPPDRLGQAVAALWQATGAMLVLVEPGTPVGFQRLRAARDWLLALAAVPVAPCPHASACPMMGDDWCHFSVRLPRSREHMHAKRAKVPFEDERFAYLAVSRMGAVTGLSRILAPPREAKPGITFKLCTGQGLEVRHIARRDGALYKRARKRDWGDAL